MIYLSNKTLRIMVAHQEHSHRVTIERHLISLGYNSVAPVGSFREVVLLTQRPAKAFDLLIISRELYAVGEQCTFFGDRNTPYVPNILIYDDDQFLTRQDLLVGREYLVRKKTSV